MANPGTVVRNLARMAISPFRERGLVQTVHSVRGWMRARRQEREEAFDQTFGTDTERIIRAAELAAIGPDVPTLWRYFPTLRESFVLVMASVHVPYEDFVFVDLGSGKGRVLLMAADYPFKRIVGVELSPALHAVAQRNVHVYRSDKQRCRTFELHCMDATDFVPPDENVVLYMFQPFPLDVMRPLLDNVHASLERSPRRIVVAYLNPIFHEQVLATGFLDLCDYGKALQPGEFDWAVYTNRVAAG